MERYFRCGKLTLNESAARMQFSMWSSVRDKGIYSAPRASSKEGQELSETSETEAAARKPPNDLRHQQSLIDTE